MVDQLEITHETYAPAYTYYHIRESNDNTCEAGVDLFDALNFLKHNEALKYNDFLEFCARRIPDNVWNRDQNIP